MKTRKTIIAAALTFGAMTLAGQAFAAAADANAPPPEMGFFITSKGLGKGGDLGGIAGADAHCQSLAAAVGKGNRTWRAYLSTQGPGAVNAIDRIGKGPWANAKGVIMATNLDSLMYDNSNFNYEHILDENGNHFSSRIDGTYDTTEHDVLTGTQLDGTAYPAREDKTCNNWTSSTTGSAVVGHADRYSFAVPGSPWNSGHGTPGCTPENLISVGGAGLLYCFATE